MDGEARAQLTRASTIYIPGGCKNDSLKEENSTQPAAAYMTKAVIMDELCIFLLSLMKKPL